MGIDILKTELADDPELRDYAGMLSGYTPNATTSEDLRQNNIALKAVLADMKSKYRSKPRESMTGTEVFNAFDTAEYLALSDAQQDKVWKVLHLGTLNPFGLEAEVIKVVFGQGSTTVTALGTARTMPISRMEELQLTGLTTGDIQEAIK